MNYEDQWRDLHRRIRLFWFVFLGGGVGVALSGIALDHLSPSLANYAVPWIGGGWLAAFAAAGVYRSTFRCPRCRNLFFLWGRGWNNPYSQKCAHCGVQRWSSGETASG
jgi:hypothetical protein